MKRIVWPILLFSEFFWVLVVIARQESELTLYKDIRPWREAASICRQLGGKLFKMDNAVKTMLTRASKLQLWTSYTSASNKIWLGLHNTTSCDNNLTTHTGTDDGVAEACLVWADGGMWDYSSDFGNWPQSSGLSSVDCVEMAATGSLYWESEPCAALHHYICENVKTGTCPFLTSSGECYGASTSISATTAHSCQLTCDRRDLCWGFKFKDPGTCLLYDNDDPFACSFISGRTSTVGIKNCFTLMYKSYTGAVDSDTLVNRNSDPPTTGLVVSTSISSDSESLGVIWVVTSSHRFEENPQSKYAEFQEDQSLSMTNGRKFYPVTSSVMDLTDWSETRPLDSFTGEILHTSMATEWPFLLSPGETISLPADKTDSAASSCDRSAAARFGLDPSLHTAAGVVLDSSLHVGASRLLESSLNIFFLLPGPGLPSFSTLLARSERMRDAQSYDTSDSSDVKGSAMTLRGQSSLAFHRTAPTKSSLTSTPLAVRLCPCHCRAFGHNANLSKEQYMEHLADLGINASKLSSTRRKLHSAPDSRASANAIGYVGVTIVTLLFSLLVVPDVVQAVVYLKTWQRSKAR